ncbi:MAG: alginate export family protein [Planctomycetota bacterium]
MLRISALLLLAAPVAAQEPLVHGLDGVDLQLGGELLFRGEMRDVADQATGLGGSEDAYLTRAGIDLSFDIHRYLRGHMEVFAAVEASGSTSTQDLQQLFLDFDQLLGDYDLRLGRMQFDLGDGRVVSSVPWLLERNSFDGLQVSTSPSDWDLRFWHTKAANGPSDMLDDTFSGFFAAPPLDDDEVEIYFLRRGRMDFEEFTVGFRWAGSTRNGLEWDVFGAFQDGKDGALEVLSQAFAVRLQKSLDYGHGVGAEIALAKGNDSKTTDRKRYDPVYIDQHRFNGRADVVAFSNLVDLSAFYWLDWNERWSFHVDFHDFSRQSDSDVVYLGYDVTPVTPASTSAGIGRELDIYCEGVLSDVFTVDFGGAIFSPQASLPHDEEQLWLYLQFVLNF